MSVKHDTKGQGSEYEYMYIHTRVGVERLGFLRAGKEVAKTQGERKDVNKAVPKPC